MIELAQNGESPELSDAFEKLGQEAARLQTVIDTVPSFLWTSLPDGSKEYLNKRWYEYTGRSLEEGKGWGWKVVVHPDDVAHHKLRTACIRFLILRSDDALPLLRFCAMQKPWKNVSTTSATILASSLGSSASMFFISNRVSFC